MRRLSPERLLVQLMRWRDWLDAILPRPQTQPIRIPPPCGISPSRRPGRRHARLLCLLAAGALFVVPHPAVAAQLDTRFGPIHFQSNEQLVAYGRQLNPAQVGPLSVAVPTPTEIVARHEYLFEQVCGRLGASPDILHATVRIVFSLDELRAIYRRLAPDGDDAVIAFYSHGDKTIWYAAESFCRDVALHEVTHAVLDHLLARPLPAAVDELFALRMEQLY